MNPVAPTNEEMQRSWDGDSGAFWTAHADNFDRSMARYQPLGPFSLSDPDRVKAILGDAGFTGVGLEAVHEPMCFGTDAADATGFVFGMLRWLLGDLDDAGRARALDALHATMSARETPEGVLFQSGGWIVRAIRP